MKKLATHGRLDELPNREAVYQQTLELLLQHGQDSMTQPLTAVYAVIQQKLAELAWETITLESAENSDPAFTGVVSGPTYAKFAQRHQRPGQEPD